MMKIKPNILEKLKCSECNEYLSCTPIFVKENGDSICGRCPSKVQSFRNKVYEEVASLILFPCRFHKDGCPKKLRPVEVAKHEENCEYQKILCPSSPAGTCTWTGFSSELLQHFREKHIDLVVDHPYKFKHDIVKNNEKSLLISVFGFLFLIQIKCSVAANAIYHSVQLIGPPKVASQFRYCLNVQKQQLWLSNNTLVQKMSKTTDILNNSIAFDIKALETIFKGFQDLHFSLLITRHEFKCILCTEIITETKTNITKECATFCDSCNPATLPMEKGLNSCISKMDGCTYNGNDNNMPKHLQWFCKFGINKCQYCNEVFKADTRVYHLMKKCEAVLVIYTSTATNELNISDKPVILRVDVYGKVFHCVFTNKRKSLTINVVTEYPKEEISNFSIEIAVDSDKLNTSKNKNNRLTMSDEANCDWKGMFNVGNVTTDVKFNIKKCK